VLGATGIKGEEPLSVDKGSEKRLNKKGRIGLADSAFFIVVDNELAM
jgi:hypothetical protein